MKNTGKKFSVMVAAFAMGVFNDNFFKQAVMLLAITAQRNAFQGAAATLYALPFVLFAAYAGWLADRFTKGNIVIAAKLLELAAMLVGAYGILIVNWPCILCMIFMMGAQSAVFGPALNGSIPELYKGGRVTRANAVLRLASMISILAGMAIAGILLDLKWERTEIPLGRIMVAATVVAVSLVGVVVSIWTHKRKPSGTPRRFPFLGPVNSMIDFWKLRKDPLLFLALMADVFFFSFSALGVLLINVLGRSQLGLSNTLTSLLSVALMVGLCAGAFLAARLTRPDRWIHILFPGIFGMGFFFMLSGCAPFIPVPEYFRHAALAATLAACGTCGGLFIIPVISFAQVRPDPSNVGRIQGIGYFATFVGIMVAGKLYLILNAVMSPSHAMILMGLITLPSAVVFAVLAKRYEKRPPRL